MPGGLLSPDLCTRDLFSVPDERVATHAGGRLGAANARRAWQSRHCAATLGVWVPRHPSRRGTLPRYSLNAARAYVGANSSARTVGGVTARRQNSRPPGPAEPKHSSAFQRQAQLDDSPRRARRHCLRVGSQAEMRPDGSTGARNRGRSRCAPAQRVDRRLVLAPIVEQVLRDRP